MSLNIPRVGSLYGDLSLVASDVLRACTSTSLVWADDVGGVFVAPASQQGIAPHSIIGMFTFGVPLADIRDDLESMRRDRARHWIVD
jgi:hypothetical protein